MSGFIGVVSCGSSAEERGVSIKRADPRPLGPNTRDMSDLQAHPHFNDQGTLNWHTKWSDAHAAAVEGGKKIFIEFGREL